MSGQYYFTAFGKILQFHVKLGMFGQVLARFGKFRQVQARIVKKKGK